MPGRGEIMSAVQEGGLLPHYITKHVQGTGSSIVRAPQSISQPFTHQSVMRLLKEEEQELR